MCEALLLAVSYDLSGLKLAEALEDQASSDAPAASQRSSPAPERTAFVRFRWALIAHGLDQTLFETVTAASKAKSITVKTGTLVDATIIPASSEQDDDARWVKHKKRPAVHGFNAQVGADAATSLVEVWVTPANVHGGRAGRAALPVDPGEVFADSAYRGSHLGTALKAMGVIPRVAATAVWTRDQKGGRRLVGRVERADPPRPRSDRENLRGLEASVWIATYAMARPGSSRRPGPLHRHCLKSQALPQHSLRLRNQRVARSAPADRDHISRFTMAASTFSYLHPPAHGSP